MIENGDDCLAIAGQMSAVRRALDAAYARMTVCFVEQELRSCLGAELAAKTDLSHTLEHMETLFGKIR
jgi:DNA-binding FrmR family transcriptional regulator